MLTPRGTKEDDGKTSTEYYYTHPQQHQYYNPVPLNDDSNNFHHYSSSIYETNQYYTLSPVYSHQQINKEDSNNQAVSSSVYTSTYSHPQHYPSEEHNHEITSAVYDRNLSSVPSLLSNSIIQQHSNYVQSSAEQANCSINNNADYLTAYSLPNGACQSGSIVVELINRPLWLKFVPHILENIITKPGRRMFPTLEFKVYGLKPKSTYKMYIDMVLVDFNHWKFNSGKWIPSGQIEQCQKTNHFYLHPDSSNSGEHWMKNEKISFSKLKLTNNKKLPISHTQNQTTFLLNSMHKYMPRLNIVEENNRLSNSVLKYSFTFPETQFIAVTAYQNTDITQLKIDNNPFAKGFRDSSDIRNTYNSYAYDSSSSSYASGNSMRLDYYENPYEQQQNYKKKRYH